MRDDRLVLVVRLLRNVRQGAAHAHARVPHAAEGGYVLVWQAAGRQGDVRGRRTRVRVSVPGQLGFVGVPVTGYR